jgi:hypothetical protein
MKRAIGAAVLGLSACGYPLMQFAVRRWGVRGGGRGGMCMRWPGYPRCLHDRRRCPGGVRAVPAALLRLELAAGMVASLAGLGPLPGARSADWTTPATARAADRARRAAVATLSAIHTVRFAIYLRPEQGRRATGQDLRPVARPAEGTGW